MDHYEHIESSKTLNSQEGFYYYLGFFVWPFVTLIAAFKYYNSSWAKNVFWLFCVFFGFTFVYARTGEFSADSARIVQLLQHYHLSSVTFSELVKSFYSESGNYIDIVQPLLVFLLSRITMNASVLFALFAFIFGYFYSRNIWYILEKAENRITGIILIFIITFALFNSIWNINGFRMYCAAHVFLYGVLPYLYEGNRKRIAWSVGSIFFHFSFTFPVAIFLLYTLIRNRFDLIFVFFILTSFIKEIDLKQVNSFLSILPGFFQTRVSIYTNTDYAENMRVLNQNINWYIPFASRSISWIVYLFSAFFYLTGRKFLKEKEGLMRLFCFALLFYGFANIFSLVPSGARFLTVANTFMFALIILALIEKPDIRGLGFIEAIPVPLMFLFIIINFRVGMDYYGLMTIFGNPVLAAFYPDTVPLIAGIKQFLF